jgi:hypothetical protein
MAKFNAHRHACWHRVRSRSALALAERLGTEAVIFPGDHGGFLGGEFGWRGQPDAFAATLGQSLVSVVQATRN